MTSAQALDFISHSPAQTTRVGARLAELLEAGDVLLLEGTLGSGKTMLAQGIAYGLGVEGPVTSPSFTLIREYGEGRLPLYHVDLYRLGESDVGGLGLDDYLFGDGVCVIEWPDPARAVLPTEHLTVWFKLIADTKRGIRMEPRGPHYEALVGRFRHRVFGL